MPMRSGWRVAKPPKPPGSPSRLPLTRRSYATHLLEAGADLRTIQFWLGHSKLEHTLVYLHLSQKRLQTITNPLDRLEISSLVQVKGPRRRRRAEIPDRLQRTTPMLSNFRFHPGRDEGAPH